MKKYIFVLIFTAVTFLDKSVATEFAAFNKTNVGIISSSFLNRMFSLSPTTDQVKSALLRHAENPEEYLEILDLIITHSTESSFSLGRTTRWLDLTSDSREVLTALLGSANLYEKLPANADTFKALQKALDIFSETTSFEDRNYLTDAVKIIANRLVSINGSKIHDLETIEVILKPGTELDLFSADVKKDFIEKLLANNNTDADTLLKVATWHKIDDFIGETYSKNPQKTLKHCISIINSTVSYMSQHIAEYSMSGNGSAAIAVRDNADPYDKTCRSILQSNMDEKLAENFRQIIRTRVANVAENYGTVDAFRAQNDSRYFHYALTEELISNYLGYRLSKL